VYISVVHVISEARKQFEDVVLAFKKGQELTLFKRGQELTLEVYMHVDYAGSIVDRRPTFEYYTFLGGNIVTWRSKKQNIVSISNAEAEFRSILGICELLWIKIILEDLKVKWKDPMKLYCNNISY